MIYRDKLGRPNADATVSLFGGIFSPAVYRLTHINDCSNKEWSIETPVEAIVSEMELEGWKCTVRKNCIHLETQAKINEMEKKEKDRFSHCERGYIRFGEPPASGFSRNFRDDRLESGVSCFEAEILPDGSYRLLLTPVLEISWLTVSNRPVYRLYGERIGTGADGEPLLHVEKCLKIV